MPSSVIKSFRYNEGERELEITFVSGRRYLYREIPPASQLRMSFSKGEFFNAHIRGHYVFERRDSLSGESLP